MNRFRTWVVEGATVGKENWTVCNAAKSRDQAKDWAKSYSRAWERNKFRIRKYVPASTVPEVPK